MSAVILQIADSVVDTLNLASLSFSFVAERWYVPIYSLEKDLTDLRVTVVPRALATVPLSRNSDDYTHQIDVAVQQKLPADALTNAQIKAFCDPLMLLVEEIIDIFRGKSLAGVPDAQCMMVENSFIFVPEHLDDLRVFTSVATLSYKKARQRP